MPKGVLHPLPFDFSPRLALVALLRTKFALSGERVIVPLAVEAQACKVS
jgi:hypothetical protein